ncbi:sigma factor [Propioniciclava soli]|uniref:Sigma factor n=1 Tax=Propioniciclava soli TaxID=2775081 RepID=A0ABZ3C5U7_9ACTN
MRDDWGRLLSLLVARFHRLDLAEDALADAVEAAARAWPRDGVPTNGAGWLYTAARRRALDRLRAEAVHRRVEPSLAVPVPSEDPADLGDPGRVDDELLRLVLLCAHPALDPAGASALTLRLVLGVGTADIARLFLVPQATMAARLTRAKRKIVAAGLPFTLPGAGVLPERLDAVARTAYLAFTAGYSPGEGPDAQRAELAGEAVRLVRLVRRLVPGEAVLEALLALMLLQHSRRDARVDAAGALVVLAEQDRARWRHDEIAEGLTLLSSTVLAQPLSGLAASYTLQAAIAREHALALDPTTTRWDVVVRLYDALLEIDPSPAAALARAVAVAEDAGPAAGLAALRGVHLPNSHRMAVVRAELLARTGDVVAARASYDEALAACPNDTEREHLRKRRALLG